MHGWTYFEMITFFFARHEGITAQRHFSAYRCSNATRRASHSVLGPALQSLFSWEQGSEAQWHKGITALSLQSKQPRNLNATKQRRQQTFGNSTAKALARKAFWRWHVYTTCLCKDPYRDLNLRVPPSLGNRCDAHVFAHYQRWYRPV